MNLVKQHEYMCRAVSGILDARDKMAVLRPVGLSISLTNILNYSQICNVSIYMTISL